MLICTTHKRCTAHSYLRQLTSSTHLIRHVTLLAQHDAGTVYKGWLIRKLDQSSGGERVAVKMVNSQECLLSLRRELRVLSKLQDISYVVLEKPAHMLCFVCCHTSSLCASSLCASNLSAGNNLMPYTACAQRDATIRRLLLRLSSRRWLCMASVLTHQNNAS